MKNKNKKCDINLFLPRKVIIIVPKYGVRTCHIGSKANTYTCESMWAPVY